MLDILSNVSGYPVTEFEPGEEVLVEGGEGGKLYFLIEGLVAITKDGTEITEISEAGAVFGEMAILLDKPHTATVKAIVRSRFHVVDNVPDLLRENGAVATFIATILARRVDNLNHYLIRARARSGISPEEFDLINQTLDTLINQDPRAAALQSDEEI